MSLDKCESLRLYGCSIEHFEEHDFAQIRERLIFSSLKTLKISKSNSQRLEVSLNHNQQELLSSYQI